MDNKNIKYKILKEAIHLIETIGWKDFSISKLSRIRNIEIHQIKFFFKTKTSILKEFTKMIDESVLEEISIEDLESCSTKDNLFEFIMLRFEKLEPYKIMLKKFLIDIKSQPIVLKTISKQISNSLDLYLELSNAKNNYFIDQIKLNTFFLMYAYIFKIWLEDDSTEMNRTMAELDKWLSKAEMYSKKINSIF